LRCRAARLLAALPACIFACAEAHALAEPEEQELRRMYADHLQQFIASQGELTDPSCNVSAKGCSVRLLDSRRDYRLVAFKKKGCHVAPPAGFTCSFEARVTCDYLLQGKPAPEVADLYCGPLFNKISTYTALVEYGDRGWAIARFVPG
jgi:hypothetical protein